jgi:diketogulonate reductase-like aldo/keto reductase
MTLPARVRKGMIYEELNGLKIPKIGFGTWRIGGGSFANRSKDPESLSALRSALGLGYSHFDTAEIYAGGHSEELLGRAIRESGKPRESLFIASKVRPEHLRYENVLKACEGSLRRIDTEYLDLYLIHWPGLGMRLPDAFRALNKLVSEGKVRHLGVSNFDLRLLRASEELSETPLLTDQVPYSLSDRSYARNGVLAYCQAHDILLTAYSPFDQGNFKPSKALKAVAEARAVSPYQIALAWLARQPRVITIPMSHDPAHQRQNLQALEIQLTDTELTQLA